MASASHFARLKNIRDNLERTVENELARVLALTEAGNPAPVTYSVGGKNMQWTEWYTQTQALIEKYDALIIAAGADDGGIPEATIQMW